MKSKTVLIVEDNPLNLELVVAILEIKGYGILKAEDAETGIQLAREQLPDLILMDRQLPGMDGLEAARFIKSDPAISSIPIVALTASAMKKDQEEALQAGCIGFITKPFNLSNFLKEVEGYLGE